MLALRIDNPGQEWQYRKDRTRKDHTAAVAVDAATRPLPLFFVFRLGGVAQLERRHKQTPCESHK